MAYVSYLDNDGSEQGKVDAFQETMRLCNIPISNHCTELGYRYFNGVGVTQDKQRGTQYIQAGCDKGDYEACMTLAEIYDANNDHPRAAKAYTTAYTAARRLCDAGSIEDCLRSGALLYNGKGVAPNKAMAISDFVKACSGGDAQSCAYAGMMYNTGEGTPKDITMASRYLAAACQGGISSACQKPTSP